MDDTEEEQKEIDKILNDINSVVESGNLNNFKEFIERLKGIQNKNLFRTCCENRGFDLISLICKHNKKKILRYLLNECHMLHYFSSSDKNTEMKYKEDAFYYAICLSHFEIIEMLYDHWTGDLHWLGHKKSFSDFDIQNLNQLSSSLQTAVDKYVKHILSKKFLKRNIDQYMMFSLQGLITFNAFQRDVYSKLNKLKQNIIMRENEPEDIIRIQETYAIRNMILDVIETYEKYNKMPESMIQDSVIENPARFMENLTDTSTLLHHTCLYVIYEVYFRKLDYNVCLLILDNLHSLKLRLSMPGDSYQKLENKVYLFIYHVSSKWSLYMPKRKKMKSLKFYAEHNGNSCIYILKFNANAFERGLHIIYLERRDFENAINCFKTALKSRKVEENIRKDQIELPIEEVNYLMLLPELRDIYSLKRMSQHIAQLHSLCVKNKPEYVFLFVERTLQVVGEFLKSTYETQHLQPTTEALIKVEISVEVVNDLKLLRDMLCHVKDGELLKRIEIETNTSDIFDVLAQELIFIKKKIDEVIMIHKPLMEKALILNGITLIKSRKNEMPHDVGNNFFDILKAMRLSFTNILVRDLHEKIFYESMWKPVGFTEDLMVEVKILIEHSLQLETKLFSVNKKFRSNFQRKLYIYEESIKESLEKVIVSKENWKRIIKALKLKMPSITLLDYPNENDANRIKSFAKKVDLEDRRLISLVENNTLFTDAENHWKFIKSLLEFIISKTPTENCTVEEIDKVIKSLESLNDGYRDDNIQKLVNDFLVSIKGKLGIEPQIENGDQRPEFTGIKKLTAKLAMVNFVTHKEKQVLTDTLLATDCNNNKKKIAKIENMIEKINGDVPIPKGEFTSFIDSIKLDKKLQNFLINLVMGYKRDPLIPWCLSKRMSLLKELTKQQSKDQLILRYKLDKSFRILFEVLLFDILAALEGTESKDITKKSSKLLTEINLRNILIHGSPLLEVVGNVLDSNDLPTELITKALDLLEDETSINALCKLMESEFDLTQINSNMVSTEQETLVIEFKTSKRWKEYLKLIPHVKQTMYKHKKIVHAIDKESMDLLKAVTDKDSVLVQRIIAEGANVNFVMDKYAVVHYAAMKGSVDVLSVLLINGVNVNTQGKHNMTALHCAAMNGFIDAVDYLLKNGADCFSLDERGRTPLDVATQRNHTQVCQVLLEAMKKGK